MDNNEFMLTTIDNPYDPFEEFTLWKLFDIEKGYNTCERLAMFIGSLEGLTQKEEDKLYEYAIERIIALDFLNIYKKAYRKTPATPHNT